MIISRRLDIFLFCRNETPLGYFNGVLFQGVFGNGSLCDGYYLVTMENYFKEFAIILMGKRELIVLLNLSSWCLVMVERLFLAVPRGCLQFVIVVFPDHTHLLFLWWMDQLSIISMEEGYCISKCTQEIISIGDYFKEYVHCLTA